MFYYYLTYKELKQDFSNFCEGTTERSYYLTYKELKQKAEEVAMVGLLARNYYLTYKELKHSRRCIRTHTSSATIILPIRN